MGKLFEIRNLDAGYEEKPVLKNINFEVHDTDFIGIIGPNGGGKTTLLKAILGSVKPSGGTIKYHFPERKRISGNL